MPRPSGCVRAVAALALFLSTMLGGCSASWRSEARPAMSAHEAEEPSEDEILSAPYGDEDEQSSESVSDQAGGMMVALVFVGVILAAAVAPLLLFGL